MKLIVAILLLVCLVGCQTVIPTGNEAVTETSGILTEPEETEPTVNTTNIAIMVVWNVMFAGLVIWGRDLIPERGFE